MKYVVPILAALGAACAMALAGCGPAGVEAQPVAPVASATPSDVEAEALAAWREGRALTARRLAGEALAADPDSMIGHYVTGASLRASDGAIAPAMYHLARARERYESTWALAPRPEDAPWELHREMLYEIQEIAQELGAHRYRLEILDFHDALYEPDLGAQRAWTLVQLGDFEGARVHAQIEAQAHDPDTRSLGLNALCAIETVGGDRDARFDACGRAYAFAAARAAEADGDTGTITGVNVAVHAYNAALAAMAAGRFDAAERFAAAGVERLATTPANPWRWRVRRWLEQGRTLDVAAAVQAMDRWRRRQPTWLRTHDRAETLAAWARVLLVAGELDEARAAIDRAIRHPDRQGLSSADGAQARGAHAVVRAAIAEAQLHRAAEVRACGGAAASAWSLRATRALDRERVVRALLDEDRLVGTLRPWHGSGLDLDPWQLGDLVPLLGAGLVERALDAAADAERDGRFEAWALAVRAEAAWHAGDRPRARALAAEATDALPDAERLLRARVAAIRGDAAHAAGDATAAGAAFTTALVDDPGVVRRLGLAVPVRIEAHGGANVEAVAQRLARSPRFSVDDAAALTLTLTDDPSDDVRACLSDAAGGRIVCVGASALSPAGDDAADADDVTDVATTAAAADAQNPGAAVCIALHDALFAAPLQLDTIDRSSLDGRTTVDEDAARDALRDALDAARDGS